MERDAGNHLRPQDKGTSAMTTSIDSHQFGYGVPHADAELYPNSQPISHDPREWRQIHEKTARRNVTPRHVCKMEQSVPRNGLKQSHLGNIEEISRAITFFYVVYIKFHYHRRLRRRGN